MVKVKDSVSIALQKRLEIIRKMLPDSLYITHDLWSDYLRIGDKVKRGIFTKYYTIKGNYIRIKYTTVIINDRKYYGLAMKIALKFDLDLVINYYENLDLD